MIFFPLSNEMHRNDLRYKLFSLVDFPLDASKPDWTVCRHGGLHSWLLRESSGERASAATTAALGRHHLRENTSSFMNNSRRWKIINSHNLYSFLFLIRGGRYLPNYLTQSIELAFCSPAPERLNNSDSGGRITDETPPPPSRSYGRSGLSPLTWTGPMGGRQTKKTKPSIGSGHLVSMFIVFGRWRQGYLVERSVPKIAMLPRFILGFFSHRI